MKIMLKHCKYILKNKNKFITRNHIKKITIIDLQKSKRRTMKSKNKINETKSLKNKA